MRCKTGNTARAASPSKSAQLNALPLKQALVVFDDVLTTGKHFKCCERRLREVVPAYVPILGVFIARRMLPDATAEFEDIT
jgi:hypothetical protein